MLITPQQDMSRGVFSADWSPEQEFKLLEALEEFGYGNWYALELSKLPFQILHVCV